MARKTKRPGQTLLQPKDVKRAIFVDYEMSMSQVHPPALLGMMVDQTMTAAIVDPLFAAQCSGGEYLPRNIEFLFSTTTRRR